MPFLTRDQILGADDLSYRVVPVPAWGGDVRIRTLTGAERDQFEASIVQRNGRNIATNMRNIRAKLVALCIVDENGERIFSDKDVEALGKKSAQALDLVFGEAQKLNGLRDEDVEELAENFVDGRSEDSPTG